ncbi:uncharacterized protein JCM10292_007610 [Rhodotorula paludigena]|uniref:uncharacterized protein n=1 Tax=Rhodotorula paludigena TaxID=86838 RepID=UPI00317F8C46
MAAAPSLADPSIMLAHERTDELVKCVERDDLLGVLLVLCYCVDDEVNGKASAFPITPLETAVCYPTRRFAVRRLIVECLLHRGASPDDIVRKPAASAHAALLSVLRGWRSGGREQAPIAYQLCFVLSLEEAETYITDNGLGPDGPHDPPPAASTGPPSGEASTSTAPAEPPRGRRDSGYHESDRRSRSRDRRDSRSNGRERLRDSRDRSTHSLEWSSVVLTGALSQLTSRQPRRARLISAQAALTLDRVA